MDKKQKLLLEYLISSPDIFVACLPIIDEKFFDPEFRNAIIFIKEYYDTHNTIPNPDQIDAESDLLLTLRTLETHEFDYCLNEIENHCRTRAFYEAVLECATEVEKYGPNGNFEHIIENARNVQLKKDLGTDYFEDPETRIQNYEGSEILIPTGYKVFDELLEGGLMQRGLHIVSANSGGGKSLVLQNFALNYAFANYHVLYVTLELSEKLISKRFDSMITGVSSAEIFPRRKELAKIIRSKGLDKFLTVTYMNAGTTTSQIRALVKEYETIKGVPPAILIVDYLDIMGGEGSTSRDNVFEKDKQVSESLRNVANDYNLICLTASQQNRGAVNATQLDQSHIAGGISKINTSDLHVSVILNDQLKSEGIVNFHFIKTRYCDGVGKTITLGYDPKSMRMSNLIDRSPHQNEDTLENKERNYSLLDRVGI